MGISTIPSPLSVTVSNNILAVEITDGTLTVSPLVTTVAGTSIPAATRTEFATGAPAAEAYATLVAGLNAGNVTALDVDASGRLEIDTVQSLPLPAGASTSALQTTGNSSLSSIVTNTNPLNLAQNSTTSGQTGNLVMGATTTAAPTYTTARTNPLSLMTTGALRIDNSSWIGSTAPTVGSKTSANSLPVVIASDQGAVSVADTSFVTQGSTTSGEKGLLIQGAVTTAAPAYTTAQTSPLSLSTTGSLRTDASSWIGSTAPTVGSKTSANSVPVVIASDQGNVAVSQATASSLNAQVVGNVASGATDSGNPVKIGGLAKTAQPTAVTDGQRVNILTDKLGRLVVTAGHIRDLVSQQQTTITNSAAETTILTAVAATFLDLTSLVITNASAATAVSVTIKDATAGTTRAIFDLPAAGMFIFNPEVPWKQAVVNNNWTATLSSNAVTVHFLTIALQDI